MLAGYCNDCEECRADPMAHSELSVAPLEFVMRSPASPNKPSTPAAEAASDEPFNSHSRSDSPSDYRNSRASNISISTSYAAKIVAKAGLPEVSAADALHMIDDLARHRARDRRLGTERNQAEEAIEVLGLVDALQRGHEHEDKYEHTRDGFTTDLGGAQELRDINGLALQRLYAQRTGLHRDSVVDATNALKLMDGLEKHHSWLNGQMMDVMVDVRECAERPLPEEEDPTRHRAPLERVEKPQRAGEGEADFKAVSESPTLIAADGDAELPGHVSLLDAHFGYSGHHNGQHDSWNYSIDDDYEPWARPASLKISRLRKSSTPMTPSPLKQVKHAPQHDAEHILSPDDQANEHDLIPQITATAEAQAWVGSLHHGIDDTGRIVSSQETVNASSSPSSDSPRKPAVPSALRSVPSQPILKTQKSTRRFELENLGTVPEDPNSVSTVNSPSSTHRVSGSTAETPFASPQRDAASFSSPVSDCSSSVLPTKLSRRLFDRLQDSPRSVKRFSRTVNFADEEPVCEPSQSPRLTPSRQVAKPVQGHRSGNFVSPPIESQAKGVIDRPEFQTHHARFDERGKLDYALFVPQFDHIQPAKDSDQPESLFDNLADIKLVMQSEFKRHLQEAQATLNAQMQQLQSQMQQQMQTQMQEHLRMMSEQSITYANDHHSSRLADRETEIMALTAEIAVLQAKNARIHAETQRANAEITRLNSMLFVSPTDSESSPRERRYPSVALQPAPPKRKSRSPSPVDPSRCACCIASDDDPGGHLLQPVVFEGLEAYNSVQAAAGLSLYDGAPQVNRGSMSDNGRMFNPEY